MQHSTIAELEAAPSKGATQHPGLEIPLTPNGWRAWVLSNKENLVEVEVEDNVRYSERLKSHKP
jgi:hypothetical protein